MNKLEHLEYIIGLHCILILVVFMRPFLFIKAVKRDGLVVNYKKSIKHLTDWLEA